MKAHEEYQRILREVRDTLEYELEGLLLELTEQIVRHMEREGINRTGLARRLGKSSPYVTKLLSGKPNMTLETIVKVARALKCEVSLNLESKYALFVVDRVNTPSKLLFKVTDERALASAA